MECPDQEPLHVRYVHLNDEVIAPEAYSLLLNVASDKIIDELAKKKEESPKLLKGRPMFLRASSLPMTS